MDRLRICSVAGGDTALLANEVADTLQPSPLYQIIEAEAARQRPALIVIDTLADVYPANENDRAKVRQFVQLLNRLAMRFDCAVVLLSHPSLAGMPRFAFWGVTAAPTVSLSLPKNSGEVANG